jgi:DNA-binding MurR/RpiR family transcriptional regulator
LSRARVPTTREADLAKLQEAQMSDVISDTNVGASDPPTNDYDELKAAIVLRFPGLSRQLQKVARFALDHPNDIALDTVARLAGRAEVQPSALVRFAQAFGYNGFSAMQRVFRTRLQLHFSSMRERVLTLGKLRSDGAGDGRSIADDVIGDALAALQRLHAGLDRAKIERAADLIARADHVYVLAQGKPFPIACYLHFALLRLNRRCSLLAGLGGLTDQQLELAGPDDALIAVSFRPYTQQVVELAGERHALGAPVIAITDSPLSPLWANASIALEVEEQDSQVYQSLIAPLCLAQVLAMSLGNRLLTEESE